MAQRLCGAKQEKTMKKIKLGESELELLRYVTRNPGCNVREASEHFAEAKNWGRTTVLKTFDRLREKGLLEREDVQGLFRYKPTLTEKQIDEMLVHQFVANSMEGSLKSFVAYLHTYPNLNADEIGELRKLVDDLEEKNK